MTIAERLKTARDHAGYTQGRLATLAGVRQGTIANIESGIRKNPRELLSIARALKVNPEWLKSGRGPRDINDATMLPAQISDVIKQDQYSQAAKERNLQKLIMQLGKILENTDELRRGAIADLLSNLAKNPSQAETIGVLISGLLNTEKRHAA